MRPIESSGCQLVIVPRIGSDGGDEGVDDDGDVPLFVLLIGRGPYRASTLAPIKSRLARLRAAVCPQIYTRTDDVAPVWARAEIRLSLVT